MNGTTSENNQPLFSVDKIYVKDLSLEIPHSPQIFLERDTANIEVQLNTHAQSFDKDMYEVVVTATVTSKIAEKVMFLIEVSQAGIFRLSNIPAEDMESVLAVMCPNILFPYLREVVSDASVRAGFPPALLNPINFEAIYQQQKQNMQSVSAATTH